MSNEKFNKNLDQVIEEEEINRYLKGAGVYDHNDTLAKRRELVQVLKQSKEEANAQSGKPGPMQAKANKFYGDLSQIEKNLAKNATSLSRIVKKPESDGDEEMEAQSKLKKKAYAHQPPQPKAEPRDTPKMLQKEKQLPRNIPVDSYAGKLLAASNSNNMNISKHDPGSPTQLLTPKLNRSTVQETFLVEETDEETPAPKDAKATASSQKDKSTDKSNILNFSDDDDSTQPFDSDAADENPTTSDVRLGPMPVTRSLFFQMKGKCRKFSAILERVDQLTAAELPKQFDYDIRGAIDRLVSAEMHRTIAADRSYLGQPSKWGKPVNLNTMGSGRRRPAKAPSISPPGPSSRSPDQYIIPESPPAPSTSQSAVSARVPKNAWNQITTKLGDVEITDRALDDDVMDINEGASTESRQSCPICSKSFPTSEIEMHAAGCNEFGGDFAMEEPAPSRQQRPVRASAAKSRSTRTRPGNIDEDSRGSHLAAGGITASTEEDDGWGKVNTDDSDSDFKDEDSGNKRARKRESGKLKKRRL